MGAGALLGAVALVARYAPGGPMIPASSASPIPAPAPLPAPAPAPAPAPSSTEVLACPPDMTLVDGDFCPELPYECLRSTGAVGCAEYSRERRCLAETDY